MKLGLFITNQQTVDTDMVSALDDQFAMVRLARDRGWDSLFCGKQRPSRQAGCPTGGCVPSAAKLRCTAQS